jgi:predicted AAA+ superfamily ATPase
MEINDILQDQNPWWRDGAIRRAREYPVRRDLQPRLLSRLMRPDDRRALVLMGPRQVGKTILLLQLADDLLDGDVPPANLTYFDFSDDRLTTKVTAREIVDLRPAGFSTEFPRILLLDEIRTAPNWDLWLKQAVDHRVARIVATDSSASLLREGARESGLGRWDEFWIEGLSFQEFARFRLGGDYDWPTALQREPALLESYLALGGFPEHALRQNAAEARRILRNDVAERAIRDIAGAGIDAQRAKDLLVYLIQSSGGEYRAEARANDLGADARSVAAWTLRLLETRLIERLEKLSRHPAEALRSRAKIFATDPGLINAFASLPSETVRPQVFEAAVFRHLRDVARDVEGTLTYFRHKNDLEIDFVLQTGKELLGIEVKSSFQIRPDRLERLRRAGEVLEASRLVCIYGGATATSLGEIPAIPLLQFLMAPASLL